MLNNRDLMRIHVETLFTHDAAGRMVRVNELRKKSAPRFFLGRTSQGRVCRFRFDLDENVVQELEAAAVSEPTGDEYLRPPYGLAIYAQLLARYAPIERQWTGPAYQFPRDVKTRSGTVLVTPENADILRPHLTTWIDHIGVGEPMVASLVGSRAVSVCCSVRNGPEAYEAGVETAEEFRCHGYAAAAVRGWAAAVWEMNRIPLYSTSWDNLGSRALARSLGLERYGADLHIV